MQGGLRALLALAGVILLVPPALAADGTFHVRSELPVTVTGSHDASAERAAFLLEGDDGRASLLLQAEAGTLDRVIHRAWGYINRDEPQLGVLTEQRVERETLPMNDAIVSLDERLDGFRLFVYDATIQRETGAYRAPLHLGALSESRTVASEAEPPIRLVVGDAQADPFLYTLRAGLYEARATDGLVVVEGPMTVFLGDALVRYDGPEGPATLLEATFRQEERPGSVYNPTTRAWTGPGTHTEYVHEYLELHLLDAHLQVNYLDVPASVFAAKPHVGVEGEALFPAAKGTVTVTQAETTTVHEVDGEDLTVGGRYAFDLTRMDGKRTMTDADGAGDLTQVTYAAQDHRYDWTAVAVAGLGALLLAALAWATGALKAAGGAIGAVFGYARVQGEEILEHTGRLEVYERVKAEPGVHFMDLCEQLDFGASTLNYHLRVLERNGYVTRVKDGRYVRFFDRRDGSYSRERKHAASTLRNEQTAAIAAHIIQNPGVVQRDLAHHFGIAASTVSWHVARLQREGLVDKQRDHHFTRYYMGAAWGELPSAELTRVGLVA